MSKQTIIAFVDLKTNKLWSRSVLGKSFDVTISGISMKIHFPGLPSEWKNKREENSRGYLDYPLVSPIISKQYKYGDEKIFYGKPWNHPSGSSYVEKIVISFEIEESELNLKKESIRNEIQNAVIKFHKLLYIINESSILSGRVEQSPYRIDLYNDTLKERIPNHECINIMGYMHDDNDSITKRQLEKILNIISGKYEIPIEYEFFISGIRAYEYYDNRQCLFDLSTACEIAITTKIEELQSKLQVKNFLNDYEMLKRKYKLLGLLNFDTSFADITAITEARNKAIHKGDEIANKEALEAIKVTRTILNKLSKFY